MDAKLAKRLLQSSPLKVFDREEDSRCWSPKLTCQDGRPSPVFINFNPGSVVEELWDRPLLRVYDWRSGSRLREDKRMLARASRTNLSTSEARQKTLRMHADYKDWSEPTPYISFTDEPAKISNLANKRKDKRGNQTLVLIDPRRRFKLGLPVINAEKETRHYGVDDPYGRGYEHYTSKYLCLWEVTQEEIVQKWNWNDLSGNEHWYPDIVMPALEAFRRYEPQNTSTDDLVKGMNALTVDSPMISNMTAKKAHAKSECLGLKSPSPDSYENLTTNTQEPDDDVSHRHERPGTQWSYELQGFYTEEDEYEQLGWNGNHERMIDGLWD